MTSADSATPITPACDPGCGPTEYCFSNSVGENAGDLGAALPLGCNPLPPGCNSCACLEPLFNPAYCNCSSSAGRPFVQCFLL